MSVDQKEIKLQILLLHSLLSVILLVLEYQTLSATFLAVEKQKVNPNENRKKSKGREGEESFYWTLKEQTKKKTEGPLFHRDVLFHFNSIPQRKEKYHFKKTFQKSTNVLLIYSSW